MTGPSSLNGSHRLQVCSFAGRRAEETLHAFLLRRHQEMGDEITAFEVMTERQASMLWAEREARIAHECSLLVGQAWIAAAVAGLFGIFRPDDWLGLMIAVSLASMIGGISLVRLPSAFRQALGRIRRWRGR
jgi:hypothetical protein